ncbi:MAG: ribose-phosphate diphosphokinase [Bacteroidota bacterium]
MDSNFKLFHTSNSASLTDTVASVIDKEPGLLYAEKFSDGEVFVRFEESVRGKTVFILAQANIPYENLFELFIAIDAARRASAKEIICIVPYLPHSRQERKDTERTSIASRLIADFIQQAGANRLITLDLHSKSIEGFFKIPVDHLESHNLFVQHIVEHTTEDLCICSPDFGGLKRIKKYKKMLNCEMAVIHKERLQPNQVAHMEIIGDVNGKHVVIVDDIIDTAGTLCKASEIIKEAGAKSIVAYCTHGLLSGNAIERIEDSALNKVYITDSVSNDITSNKIEKLSCANLLAQAISVLVKNKSIKDLNEDIIHR